jgi:hypothetical protein
MPTPPGNLKGEYDMEMKKPMLSLRGLLLLGSLCVGALLTPHDVRGADVDPPALDQRVDSKTGVSMEEPADGKRASFRSWWQRNKRALQHLASCTMASAGVSYAAIVGVAVPGGAVIGLLGAGVVILMCL